MPRRLDIGIASYGSPDLLRQTIASVIRHSVTDYRIIIVDNPHPDGEVNARTIGVVRDAKGTLGDKLEVEYNRDNAGYAGAVNQILIKAETEYIAYLDCDTEILTPAWDETLCSYLDRFHELSTVFPNSGPYQIQRSGYAEVLWGVGFAWVTSRLAVTDIGPFDETLGHQEEADMAIRARLAGYKLACAPEVRVAHNATSTNSPESIERINRGVIRWMDKWVQYFGGKQMNYYSPNVIRFEDWPVVALYLEDWWRQRLPDLNSSPEVIEAEGRQYDLIRVPRLKGFYRNRVI